MPVHVNACNLCLMHPFCVSRLQRTSSTQRCGADVSTDNTGRVLLHKNRQTCLDARVDVRNTFSPCSQLSTQVLCLQILVCLSCESCMLLVKPAVLWVHWQIWHVNPGRKLVSNATNLCAVVDGLKLVGSTTDGIQQLDGF